MFLTTFNCILLVFSTLFIIFGIVKRVEYQKLMQGGIRIKGVVTGIETEIDSTINKTYYPVIKYATLQGHVLEKKYSLGSAISTYKVDDRVTVIYNAANSVHFIIDDKDTRLLGPVLIGVGSAIIVFVLANFF